MSRTAKSCKHGQFFDEPYPCADCAREEGQELARLEQAEKLLEGVRVLQERDEEIARLKAQLEQRTDRSDLPEARHLFEEGGIDALKDGYNDLRRRAVEIQNESYEAGLKRGRADGEQHFALWAHLCSEHAGIWNHELTLAELMDEHDHEHKGPGTIRNHDPRSRHFSLKRLGKVLSEAHEDEIPPCDCGYSRSDSMTNHHESCAWLQYGRKHHLEVVARDQRDS